MQKALVLHCTLTNSSLIKQASDCGYFWKDDKRIHASLESLNNQNIMLNISFERSTKRWRITDDKNTYVMTKFVSNPGIQSSSIFNHIKHIDFPRSTKYRLFNKGSARRK